MKRWTTAPASLALSVLAALVALSACSSGSGAHASSSPSTTDPFPAPKHPLVGPVWAGYDGPAYPVPDGTGGLAHLDAVPVDQQKPARTAYLPAGKAVTVHAGNTGTTVRVTMPNGKVADGKRRDFWVMPYFVNLGSYPVRVNGRTVKLGQSGIVYHRGTPGLYDDPKTPQFDGIALQLRDYLACKVNLWSVGQQTFAVDLVDMGIAKHDQALIDKGVKAIDWTIANPVNSHAVYELHRACDGKTMADFGSTHHTTQWLESMGRAVYLLAASPYAGQYRQKINAYIDEINLVAGKLTEPANWNNWVSKIREAKTGKDFTHRTFMMANALGLASTLAKDPRDADAWSKKAAKIVQRGIHNQFPNGVNPEKGGYDVQYQMYGTWLAEVYRSTLDPSSNLARTLATTIDKAIAWESTRVEPDGQINIRGSSRICAETNNETGRKAQIFDASEAVRAMLLWSRVRHEPNLADLAVRVAQGQKKYGNTCPTTS